MKKTLVVALAFLASAAHAKEFKPAMQAFYEAQLSSWIQNPVIVEAIRAQNRRNAALSQADISALDQAWRSEVGLADGPTIAPVMDNAAASFLREQVTLSGGLITEAFAMDLKGLNVAASSVTSDYWQGDEAKHRETVGQGAGAVHYGDVEFDDSSQSFQGQISVAITDPATGQVIGAITVGVNAEALM